MTNFTLIADDGHAWLEVSLEEYPEAEKFGTGFGYQHIEKIYLEEDFEAPQFLAHLKEKGIDFTITEKHFNGEWFGRNYDRNLNFNVSGQ